MPRRRRLSAEDRALWDRVASSVERLDIRGWGRGAAESAPAPDPHIDPGPDTPPHPSAPAAPRAPASLKPQGRAAAPTRVDLAPSMAEQLAARPSPLDTKLRGRLQRGKLRPEARIDLHGLTLAEAHPRLISFLLNAQARGLRLVLVITGKGKDRDDGSAIPLPRGVLRHQVPHWLQTPPLAGIVLDLRQAHFRHGGDGAYYVYLRRRG